MGQAKSLRPILFVLLLIGIIWFYQEIQSELKLEVMRSRLADLLELKERRPLLVLGFFMGIIIAMTSLSIPGSIVLTLLAGALYGAFIGTVVVTVSATTGATVALLLSRYFFRESLVRRYQSRVKGMDRKIKEEGGWALLTVRLFPASPFVVVNLIMGLTSISPLLFAFLTFVGMFPGTFIYVYAGKQFAQVESFSDILSPPLVLGLVLLGCVPYIIKILFMKEERMSKHEHYEHRNKFYTIDGVQFEGTDNARFTKGGERSRDDVREAARLRLEDSGLDDGGIDLTFDDRILRLQGRVGSLADKRRAEEVLVGLRGVDQVINELLVDHDSTAQDVQGGIAADPQRDVDLKLHKDVF